MEEKSLLFVLLSLVSLVNLVLAGTDTVKLSDGDEGQKLYEQLFRLEGTKYTSLSPQEVLNKLKRIVTIYKSDSYDAGEPVYQPENQKKIMDMYSVITESKCNKEAIPKFNSWMSYLSPHGNLVRALNYYRDERLKKCSLEFATPISNLVSAMSTEKRLAIGTLHDLILDHATMFIEVLPFYSPEAFDKGVLAYLASRPGPYKKKWEEEKMISKSELASLYDSEIVSMCQSLGDAFHKEAEFYLRFVAGDLNLVRSNDTIATFWMTNSYICQDASARRQQVIENAYNLMVAQAKHQKRRDFFKWKRG